jgi:SAM-dependent methyltransferase
VPDRGNYDARCTGHAFMEHVTEPLLESAPLAYGMAAQLCATDPATGESCGWYHGAWQLLRLLDLVSTMQRHSAYYRDALGTLARTGSYPRVLVSSAADYSLPACVMQAYDSERSNLDLTVIDRCETPLCLTRWYADRIGRHIDTQRISLPHYTAKRSFDVICSHSFLAFFEPIERRAVLSHWHAMLRPGGKVVTANRIRPGAADTLVRFTPAQIEAFSQLAAERSSRVPTALGIGREEIVGAARAYAERQAVYSITSSERLATLFEETGFRIEGTLPRAAPATRLDVLSGSALPGEAHYAQIVATRL